ncbi:MAG: discoidin domain-containing protein [Bacteroidales bacterium]|jgi:hypothetical protein|nr:discoidin domain-containing protein [Bacteroidales bacterium]
MKKIFNILLIFTVLTGLFSCEGMMDIHKKYLEDGETVYMPKPESVEFLAGRERIVLRTVLYNSPNVKSIDIYWDNGNNSLIYPVTPSTGLDTVEIEIPDMEEKSYTFTVWTSDAHGNHSLPVTGFANSYGDLFQSSLVNQPVWKVALTEEGGEITWSSIVDHLAGVQIRYTDKNDEKQAVSVTNPASGSMALCPNVKTSSVFTYRSLFLPEENAVDTFYVDWIVHETPFPEMLLVNKAGLRVLEVSDETASDGGGMHMIIDNDLNTYWHSQWSGGNAPFPHWILLDLGTPRNICKIEIYRRMYTNYTDTKTVQFSVGDAPVWNSPSWKGIGNVVFSNIVGENMMTLNVSQSVDTDGRYMRIFLPDNNGRQTYVAISEIYIYVN